MGKNKLELISKFLKPSIEEINKFETEMKIRLPQDYKEFLVSYGGGEIQTSYILSFKSKYYDDSFIVQNFYELNDLKNINKENYGINPKRDKFISIADDNFGEGKAILISLLEKDYGKIFFNKSALLPNSYSPGYKKKYFKYARDLVLFSDNFTEFLNSYEELEQFEFESLCGSKKFQEAINLIKNGLDINAVNDEDQKLIIIATNQWNQSLELIKFLIENGANVNELDEISEYSPLILSGMMGDNPDVIKYLIENGANIAHKDQISEKTALEHVEERLKNQPNRKDLEEMYNILKGAKENENIRK